MPLISDIAAIRRLLNSDRSWSVYPLGDLAPGFFERCEWRRNTGPFPALLLLYRGFAPPTLFTLGRPELVRSLLDEIADEPRFTLHVRPEIVPLLWARWRVTDERRMWRMLLDPAGFPAGAGDGAQPLDALHLPAVQKLYADGQSPYEAPEFFTAEMLEQGVFCGIFESGELLAVAGTHVVAPSEGVAALGNIYTRRDQRGKGHGSRATAAVAAELLRLGIPTVALNVRQDNAPALAVYWRLGFRVYCAFCEGMAERV